MAVSVLRAILWGLATLLPYVSLLAKKLFPLVASYLWLPVLASLMYVGREWVYYAVKWATLYLFDLSKPLLQLIVDLLPQQNLDPLASMMPYLRGANFWIPLDFAFTLIGSYFTFYLALLAYRIVKSWIPGVSG